MSDKAVVFGVTADHAFAAGALLASILAHDANFDATVVIFHDGLPEDQQAAFLRLWPRCQFRTFTQATVMARLGLAEDDTRLTTFLARYSPLVLAKLELPDLLADFTQALWLDADILVRSPLDPLWDFDCIAWRPLPTGAFARREKVFAAFADLDLDPSVPLLNGGVVGISRRFTEGGGSVQALYDMARQLVDRAPTAQIDEMAWHLTAAALGLPVTPLPLTCNHPVGSVGAAGALVIHAIGPYKFWNATPLLQLYPDWAAHQARWVAGGGRPYAGPVLLSDTHPAEPSEVLRAAENRAYWLTVFPDLRAVLPKGVVVDLQHDRKFLRLFLHGRPEADHIRLVRMPNPRRLGVEVHLPDGLADLVANAIDGSAKGVRMEKGKLMSVPVNQIGAALAAASMALPDA